MLIILLLYTINLIIQIIRLKTKLTVQRQSSLVPRAGKTEMGCIVIVYQSIIKPADETYVIPILNSNYVLSVCLRASNN